jgi:predicted DNA-binding transcriptional regulator YafY
MDSGHFLAAIGEKLLDMANTSTRMLRLLSMLQTHRFWAGRDLAERLEVSQRTLRRDVDRLRDLGYPVNASRGVAGGYQLEAGGTLPPLLLDDYEAIAIAVGLRSAAGGSVSGIAETSVQALSKILRMMPPRLRRRAEALQASTVPVIFGGGPTVDAEVLAVIAQACQDDERLRFDYTTREGARATRLVEPNRLVTVGRRWYLVAWDMEREAWRTFRLDRLSDPRSTRYRFQQRQVPGGDAAAFVSEQLGSVPMRYQVVADIRTAAADVERIVQRWGTVEPLGERSCRLRMSVDTLDWPSMVLAAVDAEFEVVEPPQLRAYVRRMGELFVRSAGAAEARDAIAGA